MSRRIFPRLSGYLAALGGRHAKEVLGIEERRENVRLVAPLGFFVALLFAAFNILLTPYLLLGMIEASGALALLLPALMLSRGDRTILHAETLVMVCAILILGALVTLGGVGGTGLFWAYTFPFLAFFMKGQRQGWLWVLGFLLVICVLLFGSHGHPLAYPYDPVQIPHYLSSLLFMTLLASCFNLLRSRFQEKLHRAVEHNTATVQRYLEELQHLALHDRVTSLPNRTCLDTILEQEVRQAASTKAGLVCIFMRLQRMPEIANIIGTASTDDMMRQLSHAILLQLKNNGILGRPGREELLLLFRLDNPDIDPQRVLNRIRRHDFSFTINGFPIHVEFTSGVAFYPQHATDAANLVRQSEQAMLCALHDKNDICIYDPALGKQFVQHHYRFGRLREAIQNNQLALHFQPVINLRTGTISSAEALSRWPDPLEGLIPPDQFIPIAESSGLIHHLTRWSLQEAMTQCHRWQDVMPGVGVAINLSSRSLHAPDLLATLMDSLLESGIAPELVKLELTESTLLSAPEKALGVMQEILHLGMQLAIDDYGTGFSSLAYLKHLPAHELKIDQSFIKQLTTEDGNLAIVDSTITLAHKLGLSVVAEGIETAATLQQLRQLGCNFGQGYYFSKPLSADAFRHWGQHYRAAPPQTIADPRPQTQS